MSVASNLLTYINRDLSESELASAGEVLWLEKITSNQSEISISSIPDGATVTLDDQEKGMSPTLVLNVAQGDHTLIVSSPWFLSRTLQVRTTSGFKLNASVQLALSPLDAIHTPTPEEDRIQETESPTPTGSGTPELTKKSGATTIPDPKKPFVIISDTPTGFLRVRKESSTGSSEVGQVKPGDKFTILDTEGDWYKIAYDGEEEGWVSGSYAEVVE